MEWTRGSGPTSVFPFYLSRETIWLPILFAQVFAEFHTFMPGNPFDRPRVNLKPAGVGRHDCFPLSLCDRIEAHVKPFGQRGFVLSFIALPLFLAGRTAHHEGARWNPNKLDANAVREDRILAGWRFDCLCNCFGKLGR